MTISRLPLRLARREVRRRPGRTALVGLLVALPVAGMAMAITLVRTDSITPLESWERTYGQAEAAGFHGDVEAGDLPDAWRQVEVQSTWARVKDAAGHRAGVELSDLPLTDPITSGIYDLTTGRPATHPGEVVLSSALADDLDIAVGDDLDLVHPELSARVVGEVEPVGCLSCAAMLFAPGSLPGDPLINEGSTFVLVDIPAGVPLADLIEARDASQGNLSLRDVASPYAGGQDGGEAVRWSLVIGALVLTVVGIVISAAFAVGARRQLVTLGQLSASGASPATVRTALVLQGTVTGLVGSAVGFVLAAVLLGLGEPLVERVLDHRIDGYTVRPLEAVAVLLIGVGAATLAALIPARTAARIPTLAALAGRRPLAPVSRRLVAWGFASVIGGLSILFIAVLGSQSGSSGDLWAVVAIIGGVAELLGACAIAPAIVARLEPLATRLRGSLRLGARSLARNRARTGAVVSAVAAAGALAVASGGLILGGEAASGVEAQVPDDVVFVQTYGESGMAGGGEVPASVRRGIAAAIPGVEEIRVRGTVGSGTGSRFEPEFWTVLPAGATPVDPSPPFDSPTWERAIVADGPVLDALRVDDEVRDALADTGVVVLTSRFTGLGVDGDVTVGLPDGRTVPGVAIPFEYTPGYVSSILMTEEVADDLGLDLQPIAALFDALEPLTAGQRGDLEDLQYDIQDVQMVEGRAQAQVFTSIQWDSADSGPTPFQVELILSGVALVFSLFVVGVSLALAAAESKDERDVLTIAGAPPSSLARSAGARAWLLAIIGAAMAVPVGFLPVVVFAKAQERDRSGGVFNDTFPLVFPSRTVLLIVIAVPAIVAVVSFGASGIAQRLRPVRVSTATFE